MYLKSVDIVGFKSFAEKTQLRFEPGIIAIVGPNGCGKSNVSDAVRWVLGESRPTAIRGSAMEDCIFNGTDSKKPLGMAEVSLTLANCEPIIDCGVDEISVTRRVFRSGESNYFINKKACRRKDILRMFMDTGVGVDSYSIMEQGKIDQILSSRPDDRRAVFEEASGITKYKISKKEALRKLDQTEANLFRLADVIREVKRQIISLQRQAGKARRFKKLQGKLRTLDIHATNHQLHLLDLRTGEIRTQLETFRLNIDESHHQIQTTNAETDVLRGEFQLLEEAIGNAMNDSIQAKNELERIHQILRANTERIAELESLAQQNTKESEEAQHRLTQHRVSMEEILHRMKSAENERETAYAELEIATARQRETEENAEAGRERLNQLRSESMTLDGQIGRLQNELSEIDAKDRANVIRKEQLATEKKALKRALISYENRARQMTAKATDIEESIATRQKMLDELSGQRFSTGEKIQTLEKEIAEYRRQLADKNARLEMIFDTHEEDFPSGARHLLETKNKTILGPLAERLTAAPGFEIALATVLRPWMDALVVCDRTGSRNLLTLLAKSDAGAVRLLAADGPVVPEPKKNSLIRQIICAEEIRPLASRLLANVLVVETLQDIPLTLPIGSIYVTQCGELLNADGIAERWKPEAGEVNPLGHHHLREQLQDEIQMLENESKKKHVLCERLRAEQNGMGDAIEAARYELNEFRHELAIQEGESQVISRELKQADERVEIVSFELKTFLEKKEENQRGTVAHEIAESREKLAQARHHISTQTKALNAWEEQRIEAITQTSECRVQYSQCEQRIESLQSRRQPLEARLKEIEELIVERTRGINSYRERIIQLKDASHDAQAKLEPLKDVVSSTEKKLTETRQIRITQTTVLSECEKKLRDLQAGLEKLQEGKMVLEVELAEQRMRHQNALDRITVTWRITPEQIAQEPAPEWENDVPSPEEIETQVAEYRAKLDSMGPVNLVAIEEHAELEERFAFLNQQESDLITAKEQLLSMIKKINKTTTELFSNTFNKVNENFGEIFQQLFGGGSAKLVLVDETDVLESGIEIIARPPGKKLQTILLLSGGERTMTAIALLFALFRVKPSPFCVLDEIDAALDEANVHRFVTMLKSFLNQSQFILITHSRQTIAIADVIYGVTMPNRGVSHVMSMKFADYQET